MTMQLMLPLFDEGPVDLVELAIKLTDCNMNWPVNKATLARWVRKYGARRVKQELDHGFPSIYFHGGSNRYLAQWEWQLFAPIKEVFPMCL
jgi:hypothetical protein